MEQMDSLPAGRVFELELFGVTDESTEPFVRPPYMDFESSMAEVIERNLAEFSWSSDEAYNPMRPNKGNSSLLWTSVKKHLPRRISGFRTVPLSLYISVGRNALDFWHGVDAFFWWQGVYVSIDASRILKRKIGLWKERLKADFLITPEDVSPERLSYLGGQMATVLKGRRLQLRHNQAKRKKLTTVEWIDNDPG